LKVVSDFILNFSSLQRELQFVLIIYSKKVPKILKLNRDVTNLIEF